jgi:hypothetical protein
MKLIAGLVQDIQRELTAYYMEYIDDLVCETRAGNPIENYEAESLRRIGRLQNLLFEAGALMSAVTAYSKTVRDSPKAYVELSSYLFKSVPK